MRLTLLILLLSLSALGQDNLVPNPSFEDYSECPQNISHKLKVKDEVIPHWYTPTLGTPDYYHSCSESIKSRIGDNWIGNSIPEEGEAYIGMLIEDEVREYIQVKLLEPLKAGVQYDLELITAHANKTNYASNGISMMFTHQAVIIDDFENIYGYSALNNQNDFPGIDDNDWHYLSGTYIASGGEQFLTIGNTNTDSKKKHVKSNHNHDYCYYYFDFVSVVESAGIQEVIDQPNDVYYPSCLSNLVQNSGFEFHENCMEFPTHEEFVSTSRIAPFWHTLGTAPADIYNLCQGVKISERDEDLLKTNTYRGDFMAGIEAYKEPKGDRSSYSEYLVGCLKDPLEKGKTYYMSYMAKIGLNSRFHLDNLGMSLVNEIPKKDDSKPIEEIGVISEQAVMDDNWQKVSGAYTAKGGEKYILIGAFGESNPHERDMNEDVVPSQSAYYFIDNVIVSDDSTCSRSNGEGFAPRSIHMILDASDAMAEKGNMAKLNKSIVRSLRMLNERDVLSIYSAGSKPKLICDHEPSKNFVKLESKLSHINAKGTAKFKEAIALTLEAKSLKDTEREILMIVHGDSNFEALTSLINGVTAKDQVYLIGIGFDDKSKKKLAELLKQKRTDIYYSADGNCLRELGLVFNRE